MGVAQRRAEIAKAMKSATVSVPRVSVLITARDYGRYLPEAIESALSQTIPCEVIYSDDFSHDNSIETARRYESRGVIVLEAERHLGVCEARNRAIRAATGEFIVHLDGDDVLPVGFVQDHLAAMSDGVPFVYGPAQAFGDHETLWRVPRWQDYDRWFRNTCNTSSMYRKSVLDAVGGWREIAGSMWDWDLALRCSRLGTPSASEATLRYRQHADSWSWSHERGDRSKDDVIRQSIRRANITLTVASILSGRLPKLFDRWMSQLMEATEWTSTPVELLLLDNSKSEAFTRKVRMTCERYAEKFHSVRVVRHDGEIRYTTEKERRDSVATFMANACNRIVSLSHGDLVWIVEDDVLAPGHAAARMLDVLTAGDAPHAATGLYRSRHTGKLIGGHYNDGWKEMLDAPETVTRLDMSGTGCLMFWRDRPAMPSRFESHIHEVPAHDWAWGMELKRKGGMLLAVPDVRCGHASSHKEILSV